MGRAWSSLFRQALTRVLGEASGAVVAIMCAESLWWRCHRRLIADAATLLLGADVLHLGHDGRLRVHRLTEGVRRDLGGGLVYDVGANLENPSARTGPGVAWRTSLMVERGLRRG
jgi:hypothetical protein